MFCVCKPKSVCVYSKPVCFREMLLCVCRAACAVKTMRTRYVGESLVHNLELV